MNAQLASYSCTVQEFFPMTTKTCPCPILPVCDQKLADWLVFYNILAAPSCPGQISPLQFLLIQKPGC